MRNVKRIWEKGRARVEEEMEKKIAARQVELDRQLALAPQGAGAGRELLPPCGRD